MSDSARADKWLCAVRLFKTRSSAAQACAAGKVRRRGHALKAASALQLGDELEVPYPDGPGTRRVSVTVLLEKRVGAADARACYTDKSSQEELNQRAAWHKARSAGQRGRPTKKDRRAINRIRGFFE